MRCWTADGFHSSGKTSGGDTCRQDPFSYTAWPRDDGAPCGEAVLVRVARASRIHILIHVRCRYQYRYASSGTLAPKRASTRQRGNGVQNCVCVCVVRTCLRAACFHPRVLARRNGHVTSCVSAIDMASAVVKVLLGLDDLPGWFAVGALPALHIVSYYAITAFLLPSMESSGLGIVQNAISAATGTHVTGDRLALSSVLCSLLLHLLTFYPFLFAAAHDVVNNQDPRAHRPSGGGLRSRLYAGHLQHLLDLNQHFTPNCPVLTRRPRVEGCLDCEPASIASTKHFTAPSHRPSQPDRVLPWIRRGRTRLRGDEVWILCQRIGVVARGVSCGLLRPLRHQHPKPPVAGLCRGLSLHRADLPGGAQEPVVNCRTPDAATLWSPALAPWKRRKLGCPPPQLLRWLSRCRPGGAWRQGDAPCSLSRATVNHAHSYFPPGNSLLGRLNIEVVMGSSRRRKESGEGEVESAAPAHAQPFRPFRECIPR